jgi:hypothetical protein
MPKKIRSEDETPMEEYDDEQSLEFDQGEELDFGGDEDLLLDDVDEEDEIGHSVLYKGVSRPKTEEDWRQLLMEANKESVPSYQLTENYQEGKLLIHREFGFGVVSKVISPHKMEVIFEKSKKLMAMNVTPPQ